MVKLANHVYLSYNIHMFQMNSSLDRLSSTSSQLVGLYHRSTGDEKDSHDAPFLSQQSLQEYHHAEEWFTQELTAYTKKQFFGVITV